MAYEFVARNGIIALNNSTITGSLNVTGGITGSLAGTASYSNNALSASYAANAGTATSALTATSASYAQTASYANTFIVGGDITGSNALFTGTVTAQKLVVQTVSSSVVFSSGSNVFGNSLSNTQTLTGSVAITGSLTVNNSTAILSNQTSSMSVLSASYATNAGTSISASSVPYSGLTGTVPTWNQNTTGTAANVTGIVAIANGGTGASTSANAITNLGATTVGGNLFTLVNPSAITFPRINANNTISALSAADFRTAIGAGTSSTTGTVTSVGGTGTVSGLSLSGTVTSTGNLTLGGTLAVIPSNFASQTANTILAAPNGSAGVPTFRTIVAADVPTLNQNTTGNAATATSASFATNALTASFALNGGGGSTFPFTGSAQITGSLGVTGSLTLNGTSVNTGTGTTNYISKFTGTSTIGNSQIFDNGTNVGIGTASPTQILHLQSSQPVIRLTKTGVLSWFAGNVTGNNYTIYPDSHTTSSFNINSTGNVGIGTTSPTEKLDVIGGALAAGNGTIRTGITYSSLGLIGTFTNHDLGVITNGTERMRITSGGEVFVNSGIVRGGTTATDYGSLTLSGGYNVTTASRSRIEIRGYEDGAATQNAIISYTNGSEKMRITSGGNVLIGTTTDNGSRFQVNGGGSFAGALYTTAGNGIIIGGTSFAFAPDSTRGSLHIAGSTDRVLSFGTNGNQSTYIYSSTSITQIVTTPAFALAVAGVERFRVATTGAATFTSNTTGAIASFTNTNTTGTGNGILVDVNSQSGTDNYVMNLISNGTSRMYVREDGNVGIGTTSPGEKLAVNGYIGLQRSGTQYWHIGVDGSNSISFTRSGIAERMLLNSDGNLGLGVTPSAWDGTLVKAIQLADNGASLSSFSTGNTSSKFAILSNNAYYDSGGWKYLQSASSAQYRIANQEHQWYNAPSGTAGNAISFTQAMTLDASGRLFIGATNGIGNDKALIVTDSSGTFTQVLNLKDSNSSANGTNFIVIRKNDDTYLGTIARNGTDNAMLVNGNAYLALGSGATERMRITSAGNVGIGTTTFPIFTQARQLTVKGDFGSENSVFQVQSYDAGTSLSIYSGASSSDDPAIIYQKNLRFSSTTDTGLGGYNERMRITSGGNVGIGTTSPGAKLEIQNSSDLIFNLTRSGVGTIGFNVTSLGNFFINNRFGTNVFQISDGGNVLIGTTTDAGYKLDINGTGRFSGKLTVTADATNEQLLIQRASNTNAQLIIGYHSDGYGRIQAIEQNVAYRPLSLNQSGGNVGIGTASPEQLLTLNQSLNNTTIGLYNSNVTANNRNWTIGSNDQVYGDFSIVQSNANGGNPTSAGTRRFYINPSGNVGIGTTSPGAKLHVKETSSEIPFIIDSSTSSNPSFTQYKVNNSSGWEHGMAGVGDSYKYLFSYGAFGIESAKMTLVSGGNVGIGTVSPNQKLTVDGLRGQPATTGTTQNGLLRLSTLGSGYGESLDMGFHVGVDGPASYGWIQSTNQSSLGVNYTLNLNPNGGNVGIGTTSPTTKLTVQGGYANFTDGTVDIYAGSDASGGLFGTISNHYQRFVTNNSERMRITSGGNVLIGTTTDVSGVKLNVNGDIKTGNLNSGTTAKKFKIGTVTSGTVTLVNQLEIEIDSTTYFIPCSVGTTY